MKFNEFLKVCHEKEVFKKLSLYIVFSWVLIQVISVIWEPMGLSKDAMTYSLILLLVGFPTYIFLVWKTHLKNVYPSGSRSMEPGKKKRISRNSFNFQTYYFIALGFISFVVGSLVVFVYNNKFNEVVVVDDIEFQDKIAVLKFGNKTGREDMEPIGDMAADWITHGISQNQIAQVIASDTYEEFSSLYKASLVPIEGKKTLREYFNPKQIITGNYFLKNDKLIFQGSVLDGRANTVLFSFESVECDSKNPLDCIDQLKQRILGFLVTEKNDELNLQETPPNFESYSKLLEAKANIEDNQKYIDLLNQAIVMDPTYFEPKYLRVEYYYNRGIYATADSLLQKIEPTSVNNIRQKNILELLEALLRGDNKLVYRYIKKEYNYAPFDLYKNLSTMVVALEFVNEPGEVESIYSQIKSENLDLANCKYCGFRNYIQAMSYLELGEYQKVIDLLGDIIDFSDNLTLKKVLIAAHLKLDQTEKAEQLLSEFELEMDLYEWLDLCIYLGKTLSIDRNEVLAQTYFDKVISKADASTDKRSIALATYFKGDFKAAVPLFEDLAASEPENIEYRAKLAISYFKTSDQPNAEKTLSELQTLRKDYQYGALDYALAQYYATVGEMETTEKYLLKSVASGNWYTNNTYQNDPHFKTLKDEVFFKKILNFWH